MRICCISFIVTMSILAASARAQFTGWENYDPGPYRMSQQDQQKAEQKAKQQAQKAKTKSLQKQRRKEKLAAYAAECSFNPDSTGLNRAALLGDTQQITDLLSKGAKINETDPKNGWSPLHCAAFAGNLEIAQLLIQHGAIVNATTPKGDVSAMMLAAANGKNAVAMIKLLAAAKADVNRMSVDTTPLHIAVTRNRLDIAEALLDAKADANSRDGDGFTPLFLATTFDMRLLLISFKADADVTSSEGFTPLHITCANLDIESSKLLLAHGADAAARSPISGTTLIQASQSDFNEITPEYIDVGKKKIDIHAQDNAIARRERQRVLAGLLIAWGAEYANNDFEKGHQIPNPVKVTPPEKAAIIAQYKNTKWVPLAARPSDPVATANTKGSPKSASDDHATGSATPSPPTGAVPSSQPATFSKLLGKWRLDPQWTVTVSSNGKDYQLDELWHGKRTQSKDWKAIDSNLLFRWGKDVFVLETSAGGTPEIRQYHNAAKDVFDKGKPLPSTADATYTAQKAE